MTHTHPFASAQTVNIIKLFLKTLNSPARPNLIDYVHVITFFSNLFYHRLSLFSPNFFLFSNFSIHFFCLFFFRLNIFL